MPKDDHDDGKMAQRHANIQAAINKNKAVKVRAGTGKIQQQKTYCKFTM